MVKKNKGLRGESLEMTKGSGHKGIILLLR
jgi:hypothetical protein